LAHLVQPLGTVGAVVRDHHPGIRDERAVSGQDRGHRSVTGEGVEPVEGVEVGVELTVGVGHHGGASTEHGVAGEQGVVGG
jgi:hypothetical protein